MHLIWRTMPKVKICGITNIEDALFCEKAGADAIGLVFYPPSPRNVTIEQAAKIIENLPPFLTVVALFVEPDESQVMKVLQKVKIDCLQFHGQETNDFCKIFNRKWYKALKAEPGADLALEAEKYSESSAILIDSFNPKIPGGTGRTFDWSVLPKQLPKPLILAGGLNPDNVEEAVKKVKPWAVDVSGGVESAPGIKDKKLIKNFIEAVK